MDRDFHMEKLDYTASWIFYNGDDWSWQAINTLIAARGEYRKQAHNAKLYTTLYRRLMSYLAHVDARMERAA